jgi:class 3 adenylate cyclase
VERPDTEYARLGEVSLAYQVVGEGPTDLVFVPPFTSHCELIWDIPEAARMLRRLASFSRLIMFDKQGTGLSDPVPRPPTHKERAREVEAVMDAVGSNQAALFGASEGGSVAVEFATKNPDRTRALILYGTYARLTPADDYFPELRQRMAKWYAGFAEDLEHWGKGRLSARFTPSIAGNEQAIHLYGIAERTMASPGMAKATFEGLKETDVRSLLPKLAAPTLVLHRRDELHPIEFARYMAEHIPGAKLVELEGRDYFPWMGDSDAVLGEIEEFLTGTRAGHEPDRIIATVLFTDIVSSTERASQLGDERWRGLLERHDSFANKQVTRFGGRVVKSTGDGLLATFTDPVGAIHAAKSVGAAAGELGLEVTAGVHTGQCELIGADVGGIAVHIGARVAGLAKPGEVLVSSTVRDLLVGSDLRFDDRGVHALKGIPGEWRLYAAGAPAPART